MGWYKENLIGKAKATHTSRAKQGINLLLPFGRQLFSHLHENQPSSHVRLTQKADAFTPNSPSFLFLSPSLYAEYDTSWPEFSFGSAGVSVLAVPPPRPMWTPILLSSGVSWEAENALALCKHCSKITITPLNY